LDSGIAWRFGGDGGMAYTRRRLSWIGVV
jgi:hypothetical protein